MNSDLTKDKLTVAMITMNEEASVAKVIRDIQKQVPSAEILVIDSSKDRTAEIATELGARVIKQFPPKGYGPAMIKALTSGSGEVVVTLDCDDTYPADRIAELARYVLNENFDVVDASRLGLTKPKAMPFVNYCANLGFAAFASLLFFRLMTDLHSGMRAYRKSVIEEMAPLLNTKAAALPVDLLTRSLKKGYRVKFVKIDYSERIGKSTMRPLESAYWTFRRLITTRIN